MKILIEHEPKEIAELLTMAVSKERLSDDVSEARVQICNEFKKMTYELIRYNTICCRKSPELFRASAECLDLIMRLGI